MFSTKKIKIQIKSYFGTVLFEAEKEDYTVRKALQDAVLQDAVLQDADLQGADLRGADLRGAVLRGADLQGAVLQDADLQDADLQDADLRGADLQGADLQGADLQGADLRGADLRGADLQGAVLQGAVLRGADLRGADLRDAKEIPQSYINECTRDILYVLNHLKKEVPFLRQQLIAGKVDGTTYIGECACLLGTLANGNGGIDKVCAILPFYNKGLHNPGEQWFYNIRIGDTPENSFFAKHAVELCDMVIGKKKPSKKSK